MNGARNVGLNTPESNQDQNRAEATSTKRPEDPCPIRRVLAEPAIAAWSVCTLRPLFVRCHCAQRADARQASSLLGSDPSDLLRGDYTSMRQKGELRFYVADYAR